MILRVGVSQQLLVGEVEEVGGEAEEGVGEAHLEMGVGEVAACWRGLWVGAMTQREVWTGRGMACLGRMAWKVAGRQGPQGEEMSPQVQGLVGVEERSPQVQEWGLEEAQWILMAEEGGCLLLVEGCSVRQWKVVAWK